MATGDYATLATFKASRRFNDPLDDTEVARALTTASRLVDDYCRRFFYQVASSARSFVAPCQSWTLDLPDMASAPTVVTDNGSTLTQDVHYFLEPVGGFDHVGRVSPYMAIARVGRWMRPVSGLPSVSVTAVWGWPSVPPEVEEATIILAADVLAGRDNRFGVIGLDAGLVVRTRINKTAEDLLRRFVREPAI